MVDASKGSGEEPPPWVAKPFHAHLDPGIPASVTGALAGQPVLSLHVFGAVWSKENKFRHFFSFLTLYSSFYQLFVWCSYASIMKKKYAILNTSRDM